MSEIKLIASDLDGTLLLNGAQTLREDTCKYIEELLKQKGIIFFAASGRQYYSLRRLFEPIKEKIGFLCENGCVNYYENQQLFKEVLKRELAMELINEVLKREKCEVMVSGAEVVYLKPKNMQFYYYMRDFIKFQVELVEDMSKINEDFMKVSIYEEGAVNEETVKYFHEKYNSKCTVVTSGNEWLDMIPKNVNKGSALKKILEYLGISPENCMAIGDSDNDIEMLKLVKYPVTVESASSEIKAYTKIITDNVENLFKKILSGNF